MAWRGFNTLGRELTSKQYLLELRLRLLNATITPTLLYGCATCIVCMDNIIMTFKRLQRKMLRMMIRVRFARLLYHWIEPILENQQTVDQAAFRHN